VTVATHPGVVPDEAEDDEDEDGGEVLPFRAGMLDGPGDRYVVTEGPYKGMKGYFARNANGEVDGVHLGGRLGTRTAVAPSNA
jgi:hypothetical protein